MYIENGQFGALHDQRLPNSTGTGPNNVDATTANPGRLLTNNTFYIRFSAQYPLFVTKAITDKSIYDWTSINIAAPNYGKQKAETSIVTLEQDS